MRLSLMLLALVVGAVLFAPLITEFDPLRSDLLQLLSPPSWTHPLGTDELGRDVLSRLLYGGRTTLAVAIGATFIAVVLGLAFGGLAAASQRWLDQMLTLSINVTLSIPSLITALVILTLLGRGAFSISLATGLAQAAFVAQVTQGTIRQVRQQGYIDGSRALGATRWHILFAHIIPNSRNILLGYGIITFAYSIINSAGLSLLGLGPEPGTPDWGVMLAEGRNTFRIAPWVALAPGLAISMVVMALNRIARRFSAGTP